MKRFVFAMFALTLVLNQKMLLAQNGKYPPIKDYLMQHDAEVALAKSAAPANISDHATIKVLTTSGFKVVHEGDNGFVCEVMRAFSAPTYTPAQFRDLVYDPSVRAPICFNPQAAREVLPYYELRTKLAMEGDDPDKLTQGVQAAYDGGQLPKRSGVSFAYMWSADQNLAPGIGCWHPHVTETGDSTKLHPLPKELYYWLLSPVCGLRFAVCRPKRHNDNVIASIPAWRATNTPHLHLNALNTAPSMCLYQTTTAPGPPVSRCTTV